MSKGTKIAIFIFVLISIVLSIGIEGDKFFILLGSDALIVGVVALYLYLKNK